MANKRTISILVFFFIAAAGIFLFARPKAEDMKTAEFDETKPAAEFSLPDINGTTVSLSDFKGKVVVVNFWATWCGPCVKEIPDFIELQNTYGKDGLQFIGIALDEQGVKMVKPFSEKLKINYPSLIGTNEIFAKYGGSSSIPVTCLIDKKGNIRISYIGKRPKETLEELLLAMMKEK